MYTHVQPLMCMACIQVGSSLFTSPSMQRFKKQTDDMFASLSWATATLIR